jgi:predicted MFS family arabinose efflux permease
MGPLPTAALALAAMAAALTLQSFALKFTSPEQARYIVLLLIFCWGISGWTFYPAQVASIIRIDPQASAIAMSLNNSAMYLGFAIGGAAGGLVLSVLGPTDLGWIGGSSVCLALALLLFRRRRAGLMLAAKTG